jgi:cytoskeletal protein CcmA (bactofilin family)
MPKAAEPALRATRSLYCRTLAHADSSKERVEPKESIISSGLAIEGKISGTGHVRIAGQFKARAHVDGNLSIEPGANTVRCAPHCYGER